MRAHKRKGGVQQDLPTRVSTMVTLLAVSESKIKGCFVGVVPAEQLLLTPDCCCHDRIASREYGVEEEGVEKESMVDPMSG
jgi:hypothetical protein